MRRLYHADMALPCWVPSACTSCLGYFMIATRTFSPYCQLLRLFLMPYRLAVNRRRPSGVLPVQSVLLFWAWESVIALPPRLAATPAPAKACNDLAPWKPKYVAAHARPSHTTRPNIGLGLPDQFHQVIPKGHLAVYMSRVDNISTFTPRHTRTS